MMIPVYLKLLGKCHTCGVPTYELAVWHRGPSVSNSHCYSCLQVMYPGMTYRENGRTWSHA